MVHASSVYFRKFQLGCNKKLIAVIKADYVGFLDVIKLIYSARVLVGSPLVKDMKTLFLSHARTQRKKEGLSSRFFFSNT